MKIFPILIVWAIALYFGINNIENTNFVFMPTTTGNILISLSIICCFGIGFFNRSSVNINFTKLSLTTLYLLLFFILITGLHFWLLSTYDVKNECCISNSNSIYQIIIIWSLILVFIAHANSKLMVTLITIFSLLLFPFLIFFYPQPIIPTDYLLIFKMIIAFYLGFLCQESKDKDTQIFKKFMISLIYLCFIILGAIVILSLTNLSQFLPLYLYLLIGGISFATIILEIVFLQALRFKKPEVKTLVIFLNLSTSLILPVSSHLINLTSDIFSIFAILHFSMTTILALYWSIEFKPWIIVSRKLTPQNFSGITLYPFIFCCSKEELTPSLLNHEKIHIAQQKELLVIGFYVLYAINYILNLLRYKNKQQAYQQIIFEQESYINENNLSYLHERKFWAFLNYLGKKHQHKS